jgi:hypothetical protein
VTMAAFSNASLKVSCLKSGAEIMPVKLLMQHRNASVAAAEPVDSLADYFFVCHDAVCCRSPNYSVCSYHTHSLHHADIKVLLSGPKSSMRGTELIFTCRNCAKEMTSNKASTLIRHIIKCLNFRLVILYELNLKLHMVRSFKTIKNQSGSHRYLHVPTTKESTTITLEEVVLGILIRIVCLANYVERRSTGQHLEHQYTKRPPVNTKPCTQSNQRSTK